MRTTRSIRKATNPERKKNGKIVKSSTIPSKDLIYSHFAQADDTSGNRYSAVQIQRAYSIQKMIIVINSIFFKIGIQGLNSLKVNINIMIMLTIIVNAMPISKSLLGISLRFPICIIEKTRFFESLIFHDCSYSFFTVIILVHGLFIIS